MQADDPLGAPHTPADRAIRIRGARTHNLRGVDVDIPRNRLVVITGVSGSGKSSLAFDTLLAESQRQYIDSLSVDARRFLDQMPRPDVDLVDGLQPAVAIDQSQGSDSPRSTVGTITEVYDYLRLLYARAGDVACPACGVPIVQQTPEEVHDAIRGLPMDSRAMILAPLVSGRKGKHAEVFERAQKAGFVRVRVDGLAYPIEDVPELAPQKAHTIEAVVDRVVLRDGVDARLAESVRLAVKHGDGVVRVVYQSPEDKSAHAAGGPDAWRERLFNTRCACPECKSGVAEVEPRVFSFNSPYGACPACGGLGLQQGFDPELVLPDHTLGLDRGAVAPWREGGEPARAARAEALAPLLKSLRVDRSKPLEAWPAGARQALFAGDGPSRPGVATLLEKELATATRASVRERLEGFRGRVTCPACEGSRLRPEARACRVGGLAIHELTKLTVRDAAGFLEGLAWGPDRAPVAEPLVAEVVRRLRFLDQSGADYLSLDRPADTLSGGELQRVRLATGIGSGLVGVMYLLDEPSIGLHPRDNDRLLASLQGLRDQGNTVIVVEHDEAVIRAAETLIDVGPGAGSRGGRVVAQGTVAQVAACPESVTGRWLARGGRGGAPSRGRVAAKPGGGPVHEPQGRALTLAGAALNNLRGVEACFPLGALVCVTGVSGSGKSSLVVDTLAPALTRKLHGSGRKPGPFSSLRGANHIDRVVEVSQAPIGRSPRSNAATYTGLFDEVRKLFARTKGAKQRGFKAGRFSFNVKGGRCEECRGHGERKIEMNFLPDLRVTCEACRGARFNRATLAVRFKDKNAAEVLAMPVDEALDFFSEQATLRRLLQPLHDVGLGYLPIGQASTTLSGGEAQRIKLAAELGAPVPGHTLYLLDEPTTGLHAVDIDRLLGVLQSLVDAGNTVLVIEHNLDVMRASDWIVDLGPEGGAGGGTVVAAGTPGLVASCGVGHTSRWLAKELVAAPES